jgi:membrane protein involved in colicin uptake
MAKEARRKKQRTTAAEQGHAATADVKRPPTSSKATTTDGESAGKRTNDKKRSNEIDDLFSTLDTTKGTKAPKAGSEVMADDNGKKRNKEAERKQPKKIEGSKDDIFGTGDVDGRKRTEEGYKIYTEDELGLGASSKNAGYTKDCPFDCNCCF